ncbi:MAG TPA: HAD family phosphatase [Clostridiaceae bacterium]
MTKNIIFDLGNVLLDYNPSVYINKKFGDSNKGKEVLKAIFAGDEWNLLDKGVISQEVAIEDICGRNPEIAELIRKVMDNWVEILVPIEGTVNILKELSSIGYGIYFLSNFHSVAYESVTKSYDFFQYFNGGILSFKEKLLKPDYKIFEKLVKTYKINPKESIFIDDLNENIEAARNLEFEVIRFISPEDLKEKLKEKNVI